MRNIIRFMIMAVALSVFAAGAVALKQRSEASSRVDARAGSESHFPDLGEKEPPKHQPPPVYAAHNPDAQNAAGDLIEVSIDKQRLTAWHDGKVVHRFIISTGRPGYDTPTGHYKILAKIQNAWSRKWSVWMPWALNWHGNYFFHQLPHKDGSSVNIGSSNLGKPASHGCVRVNVGDAEKLFKWASVGTPVWVH